MIRPTSTTSLPALTALGTYNLVVSLNSTGGLQPLVKTISVVNQDNVAYWVQVFGGVAVPSNGAVPVVAPMYVPAGASVAASFPEGFSIMTGSTRPTGLVIVASSTEDTLTAVAGAKLDITAYVEDWEPYKKQRTATVVGDLTTGVGGLQVWAQAAGLAQLLKIEVINNAAGTKWLGMYAVDSPTFGTNKLLGLWKVTAAQKLTLDFGDGGAFYENIQTAQGADSNVYTNKGTNLGRFGCTLKELDDDGEDPSAPEAISSGTDFNIRATYRAFALGA